MTYVAKKGNELKKKTLTKSNLPWVWTILDRLLSILPPFVSIIHNLKLRSRSKRNPWAHIYCIFLHHPAFTFPVKPKNPKYIYIIIFICMSRINIT